MYTIYNWDGADWSPPVLIQLLLTLLLLPLENHRAEPPVWGELAVRELQVRHRRRVVPAVQPPSDGFRFVGEPIRCDVRIIHQLLFSAIKSYHTA